MRYWDGRGWTGHVALPAEEKQPHPTLPIRAAWGAVITLLVSLIAGRYLLKAISTYDWPIAVYVTILAIIGYAPALVWCWYSSRRWGTGHFRADVGLSARWSDAGWGPLTWGACLLTQVIVALIVVALKIPFTSNVREVSDLHNDRGYVVSLLVLAVVAAPICEEIVFRGVILRGFLSRGTVPWSRSGCRECCSAWPTSTRSAAPATSVSILVLASVGCVARWCGVPLPQDRPDDDRPRDPQRHRDGDRPQRLVPQPLSGLGIQWEVVDQADVAEPHRGDDGCRLGSTTVERHRASPSRRSRGTRDGPGLRRDSSLPIAMRLRTSCSSGVPRRRSRIATPATRTPQPCGRRRRGAGCDWRSPARRARAPSVTSTISMSMSRSATMRRMIASCWKSLRPNTATSGWIAPNSLVTTVVTPRK